MAGFTNYGENLVINEVLRSRQLYVGLMKANPEEAGNSSSEVNAITLIPIFFASTAKSTTALVLPETDPTNNTSPGRIELAFNA